MLLVTICYLLLLISAIFLIFTANNLCSFVFAITLVSVIITISHYSCFTIYLLLKLLLKVIFSLQNSKLKYSVDFLPDLVQIQVRETVSRFFDTNGHLNASLAHGGSVAKGFQPTSYDAINHRREPTWNTANDGGSV